MTKAIRTAITCLFLVTAIQAVMCNNSTDPKSFFPSIDGNLTRIAWAHAVNSQEKLAIALKNDAIMMLEADVSLGNDTTNTTNMNVPIMAHPPNTTSDLTLQNFLKTVIDSNTTKGIKLDFKSIEAFNASKPVLENKMNELAFPVFLNADILPGPVNATALPVDAKAFLSGAKAFTNYTLSVGWTTRYDAAQNGTKNGYTTKQIQAMIDVLKEQNVTQPITYPVRAALAVNDVAAMESLIKKSPGSSNATLTVWSNEKDVVDADQLSTLIKQIGVSKVYVDVPADLAKKLNLSGASSVGVAATTTVASLLIGMFLPTIVRRL
ncbi:protein FAM151B [Colletes gigas]|uniref:protein FAM151B n=1 Tax=Colletes gigas TaxID=935657 RepID=UPI001C9A8EDC|nr:protein FAM151B [Colletes gigas]